MKIKTNAIRLAEIQEFATWTHQEMDEAAAELRAQDAVIDRLIKRVSELSNLPTGGSNDRG
jgi:uncharacterized protein YggL (DUF469 family)